MAGHRKVFGMGLEDLALALALAAIVLLYAMTKNPLLGMAGLLALLALLARDVFAGKREYREDVSLAGIKIKMRDFLAGSALLSLAAAYFSADIIRLFSALLFIANIAALAGKKLGLDAESLAGAVAELDSAFFAALFAWLAMGFVLSTPTPLDVVTSCSMLPAYDRGDLIILQGGGIKAPEVELTKPVNPSADFIREICTIRDTRSGAEVNTLCTSGITVDGKTIAFDKQGDTIVYAPKSLQEAGLIVHRAVLKMKKDGKTYYLTKGDNNPVTDVEGIVATPPEEKDVMGRVIARLPYVGYLKLFLALQFDEPPGCRRLVTRQETI